MSGRSQVDSLTRTIRSLVCSPAGMRWIAGLVTLAVLVSSLVADRDLFARLAVGRLILTSSSFPHTEQFSFIAHGRPWVDHEWLSGVVFYALTEWGGAVALFVFKLFAATLTVLLLCAAVLERDRTVSGAKLFCLLFVIIESAYLWGSTVRSQVFTYVFLAATLLFLVRLAERQDWQILVVFPAVMLLWANAHGGFVVGLGLVGLFAAACIAVHRWYEGVLAALACIIGLGVTAINPYGFNEYWAFILEAVTKHRPTITEWQPLELLSVAAFFVHAFSAALVYGAWKKARRQDLPEVLMILATAFYGYRHIRFIGMYMMVGFVFGLPFLCVSLEQLITWLRGRRELFGQAAYGALALALLFAVYRVLGIPSLLLRTTLAYDEYPVRVIEALRQSRRSGKLLVDFNNGSFALWRLYPDISISVDGRYEEVYSDEEIALNAAALDPLSPDHKKAFRQLDPDFVLLPGHPEMIRLHVATETGYRVLVQDHSFALLGRGEALSAPAEPFSLLKPEWVSVL